MRRLVVAALIALSVPVLASAQDDCPESYVCVDYSTAVIEIDPSLGFLQSFVVEERGLTIKALDGTMTEQQVKVATFIQDGDTYRLEREDIVPQSGIFSKARLGDVYTLQEAE